MIQLDGSLLHQSGNYLTFDYEGWIMAQQAKLVVKIASIILVSPKISMAEMMKTMMMMMMITFSNLRS